MKSDEGSSGDVLGHSRSILIKPVGRSDTIDQMISGFELEMDKREGRNMTRQQETNEWLPRILIKSI